MDNHRIQKLLDRYFEGLSNLEEEAELREFFHREDLPGNLLPYRPLFAGMQKAHEEKVSEGFDEALLARLDELDTGRPPIRLWASRLARVAAIALIAIAAWWMVPRTSPSSPQAIDWSKYEPDTPEEALLITMKALKQTSSALKEGTQAAEKVEKLKNLNRVFQHKN